MPRRSPAAACPSGTRAPRRASGAPRRRAAGWCRRRRPGSPRRPRAGAPPATPAPPARRSPSSTRRASGTWAPERTESPITSTSSSIAAGTLSSGERLSPVYTTSPPASRSACATTFAPRSWPSSPGFATRIFIQGTGTRAVATPVPRRDRGPRVLRHAVSRRRHPEGGEPAGVARGVGGDPQRRQRHALADAHRAGIRAGENREDAMAVHLDDREHARRLEPGGQARLLHRERVDRALARQVHPLEPVRDARRAEAARRPRRRAAAGAPGRHEPPLAEGPVELVELRLLRRLERERIDRPEVAHASRP